MKVLTVMGARPQFIKAGPVSRALRTVSTEILVHTGQHYDTNMSDVFFSELNLPKPDYSLGVGSGSHAHQTADMMVKLEEIMVQEAPDWVLVYGDTNSTLAGALAAAKLHLPIAHVEAGLRSFNRRMPEEINRVLTDHVSSLLFAPTDTAVAHLEREGITQGVVVTGDVMVDSLYSALRGEDYKRETCRRFRVSPKSFILATIHRAENTEAPERLVSVLNVLANDGRTVILPLHPRTRNCLKPWLSHLSQLETLHIVEPLGFLEMAALESSAEFIVTDSGGVQKEAYILGTRCVTLRAETEWVETLDRGWNMTIGLDPERLRNALALPTPSLPPNPVYGDGHAAERIAHALLTYAKS